MNDNDKLGDELVKGEDRSQSTKKVSTRGKRERTEIANDGTLRKKLEVNVEDLQPRSEVGNPKDSTLTRSVGTFYARIQERGHIEHLVEKLRRTKEVFDYPSERQIAFSNFKTSFNELYEELLTHIDVKKTSPKIEILSYIDDAIHDLKAENLTLEQIESLIEVFKVVQKKNNTREDLNKCDDLLMDSGIDTLLI